MTEIDYNVGDKVFFYHPKAAWIKGSVREITVDKKDKEKRYVCMPMEDPGLDECSVKIKYVYRLKESELKADMVDLLQMVDLHEASLQNIIHERFKKDEIYTFIGSIVLAVNPFKWTIPWVQPDMMHKYINQDPTVRPHSWAVADRSYRSMISGHGNQSILCSGESGAGKTEAAKQVIKYLSVLSCSYSDDEAEKKLARQIASKIQEASPILEAFGNAKTINNDNSSRFGKFVQLQFDSKGIVMGASIINYLLEKSRVISQAKNERGFHIFYEFLEGITDAERVEFKLGTVNDYPCLIGGNCNVVDDHDDKQEFAAVRTAMDTIGMSKEEQKNCFIILSSILHLSRLEFEENEDYHAHIKNKDELEIVANLLQVDAAALEKSLTTKTLTIMKKSIVSELNQEKSIDARDGLMKALYSQMFNWIIKRINDSISATGWKNFIGLLDIFGFEQFEVNSFEQFCINFANETLQHHYNLINFKRDMKECMDEGIDVTSVKFQDNTPCIELIQGAKGTAGILDLLDEQCGFPRATDDTFLDLIKRRFNSQHKYFKTNPIRHKEFQIDHYANQVEYSSRDWLEKNKDLLKEDMIEMLEASKNPWISTLVPKPKKVKGKTLTLGGQFKKQLSELMKLINQTQPSWIRCIKPHPSKKPGMFSGTEVMNQLRSSGVLSTIKMRREGFSVRILHQQFWKKYRILIHESGTNDVIESCRDILEAMGFEKDQAQIGKTKVFLRIIPFQKLEKKLSSTLALSILVIQKYARMKLSLVKIAQVAHERKMEKLRKEMAARKHDLDLLKKLQDEQEYINLEIQKYHNIISTQNKFLKERQIRRQEVLGSELKAWKDKKDEEVRLEEERKRKEIEEAEQRKRLLEQMERDRLEKEAEEKRLEEEARLDAERKIREAERLERERRRKEIVEREKQVLLERRKQREQEHLEKLKSRTEEREKAFKAHKKAKKRAMYQLQKEKEEKEREKKEKLLKEREAKLLKEHQQADWEAKAYAEIERELLQEDQLRMLKRMKKRSKFERVSAVKYLKQMEQEEKARQIQLKFAKINLRKRHMDMMKAQDLAGKRIQKMERLNRVQSTLEEKKMQAEKRRMEIENEKKRQRRKLEIREEIAKKLARLKQEEEWMDTTRIMNSEGFERSLSQERYKTQIQEAVLREHQEEMEKYTPPKKLFPNSPPLPMKFTTTHKYQMYTPRRSDSLSLYDSDESILATSRRLSEGSRRSRPQSAQGSYSLYDIDLSSHLPRRSSAQKKSKKSSRTPRPGAFSLY